MLLGVQFAEVSGQLVCVGGRLLFLCPLPVALCLACVALGRCCGEVSLCQAEAPGQMPDGVCLLLLVGRPLMGGDLDGG